MPSSKPHRRARRSNRSPGRRERRRAETRETIFRAALALFAERGFVATTIEQITEAADVGKGTFFNYFPSKEHVLAAFGDIQLATIAATVSAGQEGKALRKRLHAMVQALAEEPSRSPELVRAILAANLTSIPVRRLLLLKLGRGVQLLAGLFAAAQARGEITGDMTAEALARTLQQAFFGALVLWSLDPSEKLQVRLDRALELFWRGISAEKENRA
jgi:AcrR family transcriptional regulator